jgi:hypothetical protein
MELILVILLLPTEMLQHNIPAIHYVIRMVWSNYELVY